MSGINKNRGVLDSKTYKEPSLDVGDKLGRIDMNNVDYGLIRNMLGDEGEDKLNAFLNTQDFQDYDTLERDSMSSVANDLYNFKADTKSELVGSGRGNAESRKAEYDSRLDVEGDRLQKLYPKARFQENSDIFSVVEGLRDFGTTDEEAKVEIGKLQDKWQNKMYGR